MSAALSGCEEEGGGSDDLGVQRTTYYAASGGKWGCKTCGFTNSPILNGFELAEASFGSNNPGTMAHFSELIDPSGDSWDVKVDAGHLAAVQGGNIQTDQDIVGWTLRTKWPSGAIEDSEIYAFSEVQDWTDGAGSVPTYGLAFVPAPGDGLENVCAGMDLDETSVVFLDSERYDFNTGSVLPNQGSMTTMACRGHALAKMTLLQHVPYDGVTSPEEREATLRMIRADYCGDGTSHTLLGTAIVWADDRGFVAWDSEADDPVLEAHWSDEGALCLGKPRLAGGAPDPSDCKPPPCDEEFFSGNIEGIWTTVLP